MKKFFVLFIPLIFFPLSSAFAKVEFVPQDKKPRQWIQAETGGTFDRGIDRKKFFGGGAYDFDWQPFSGFAGAQIDANLVDATLRTAWLPIASERENGVWRFGAAAAWHLQRSPYSYTEHDILGEIEARWISKRGLTFTARTGYSWRITSFDALENFSVGQSDFVAYAEIDKLWKCGLELFTSIGTYNLYRYPLLFCPQWTFGAAWNIKDRVRVGALLELGMTDFFASVAYFNHVMIKCNARFMF